MTKQYRHRCPLCKKAPNNIAKKGFGYHYSCLCKCSMVGRHSFDEQTAVRYWNELCEKREKRIEQEKGDDEE